MTKNYSCDVCNYYTDRLSSLNKHLTTIKHNDNVEQKELGNKFKCKHCNMIFLKKNKSRHIDTCKQNKNTKNSERNNSKKTITLTKNEPHNMLEKIVRKVMTETPPQITNQIVVNNGAIANIDKHINYNYVLQHFTDPYTIEECMNPPLNEEEKKYILNTSPAIGYEYLIKKRCIDNIPIDKRPFHCLDLSRTKFAIYCNVDQTEQGNNEKKRWYIQYGNAITNSGTKQIEDLYGRSYHDIFKSPKGPIVTHKSVKKIQKNIGELSLLKKNVIDAQKI